MAWTPLNGSLATIDVSMDATSTKCVWGRWFIQIVRGATSLLTFCSGNWIVEQPGAMQLIGRLDGFAGTGAAYADPLVWITKVGTVAFILTADTGKTLTFAGNVFEDSTEVVAGANAGRSAAFRSSGAVVSAGFSS